MDNHKLRAIVYQALLDLATEEGINAAGKDEIYGCIFGRDSAITILKILRVCEHPHAFNPGEVDTLLHISKRALLKLASLQGQIHNIESGEEPGKFIHEYRKDKYEHLLQLSPPWYVYADNTLRNYDSIDSTPLGLIAIHHYWQITKDKPFIEAMLPAVEKGIDWIMNQADKNGDGLVDYEFPNMRKFGGLKVQSWTDSLESIRRVDGSMPEYPISPVEVQGYAWYALKLWGDYLNSAEILNHAAKIKESFNRRFIFEDSGYYYAAQAIDGQKQQLRTITSNPLLLLWATYEKDGTKECVLDSSYIADIVSRAFMPDLFDESAGLRTMSSLSPTYNPREDSYHNGSFWPKLNGMAHEGLMKWGFLEHAARLKTASLQPLYYFGTPIELYIKTDQGKYMEYRNEYGQVSCRQQAWSAAAVLDLLTE